MVDRAELRRLAEEAIDGHGWYPAGVIWDLLDGVGSGTKDDDAAYISAASPDVVLGLLDEIDHADATMDRMVEECDQLRAVAVRLKLALKSRNGCARDEALADPEVEKL